MQSIAKTMIQTSVIRPPRALKGRSTRRVAPRAAISAPVRAVIYDPDQYDVDANSGRGSGFVPVASAPAQTYSASGASNSRPTRVTYGSDGVIYDPDQYDPDANVRSGGAIYTPKEDVFSTQSSAPPGSTGPVTRDDVIAAQNHWANSIVDISRVFLQGGDYVGLAGERAGELYGYGHSNVLFKPTKASEHVFRPDATGAMSYFVGYDAVPGGFSEDHGFAINAKKGFSKVVFNNHQIDCHGEVALAMGTYDFTCATTGAVSSVEFTFGYKRNDDGKVRICLHHSSIPYAPAASATGPVTRDDVIAAQNHWANSIVDISRVFLQGGDYVGLAGERAGELYGYGHSNVLFKPTKASEHVFRPDATGAMSYFVGYDAVPGGFSEDHGFAINAKKGFSKVVFNNHQIDCHGEVALAMGTYDFTCATTGAVSSVEFTFGYKRNDDGKVRICLHHSSIPYAPH